MLTAPSADQDDLSPERRTYPAAGGTAVIDRLNPAPHQSPAHNRTFEADIAIVGLGYVGLPTALAFFTSGRRVIGVDVSRARLAAIRTGAVDLLDADQRRLTEALHNSESFKLTDDLSAIGRAAAVLVCVPTPVDHHLQPDLSPLTAACRTAVAHAVLGQILMLTSTTYVGCTRDLLVLPLQHRGLVAGRDVHVAFAPERIDPGNAEHSEIDVPRVVGGVTPACTDRALEILSGGARRLHPVSSAEVAEMTKLYENTFRAVNIALANEFADISGGLGLDVAEVIDAAATKPYGFMPFSPGPGVGGHCIPCDPHYLLWQLRGERISAPVIESAMNGVASRPRRVVQRAAELLAEAGRPLTDARILLVGVAYKPGVSDTRESPALEIIQRLRMAGAQPHFTDRRVPSLLSGSVPMRSDDRPDATDWDLVIVHTVHPGADLEWLADQKLVLDTTYRLGIPGRRVL
jgi:UDP-N-acetyl-D-glucosamine dehydrogenase